MSAWTVYWLFKLDDIQCVFLVASIIIGISFIISCLNYAANYEYQHYRKKNMRIVRHIGYTLLICATICTFIPSTKTMAAIIVLPRIASAENLDVVSKDAGDIYNLAMARLKDALGEPQTNKAS